MYESTEGSTHHIPSRNTPERSFSSSDSVQAPLFHRVSIFCHRFRQSLLDRSTKAALTALQLIGIIRLADVRQQAHSRGVNKFTGRTIVQYRLICSLSKPSSCGVHLRGELRERCDIVSPCLSLLNLEGEFGTNSSGT